MDRNELLQNLKASTLDEPTKEALIQLLESQKRYGLVWEDKPEAVEALLHTQLPIVEEIPDRTLVAQEPHAPDHALIEGDNLHALTCLAFTHERKVDVIYIDPPYNTGNKDFRYNDSYVDKEDGYRHSKWLSFMDKRLRIAKKLLKDSGVIFISIDDNEQAQLKLLCDEIFGQENFVGAWSWFKSATPPNLSKKIKKNIEYILCFQKTDNNIKFRGVKKVSNSDDPITKPQNSIKELAFAPNSLVIPIGNTEIEAGIYGTEKYPNELCNNLIVKNGTNANTVIFKNRFTWTQEKLDKELANKTRISLSKNLVISYKKANYEPEVPPSLINETVGVDTTENAGRFLIDLFGGKDIFSYPKPVSLIKYLINFIDNPSSLILDFFAGSGTTLHAVMALNAEDGGNRQCILVTNNENGIAEEVCYERCKRVIQGYTNAKGTAVAGLSQNNLRYYRTGFVDKGPSLRAKREIVARATALLCLRHGCYIDIEAQSRDGAPVPTTQLRLLRDAADTQRLLIVFDDDAVDTAVEVIKNIATQCPIYVYVFSPGSYAYQEDFEPVEHRIRLQPIPDALYNAYRHACGFLLK